MIDVSSWGDDTVVCERSFHVPNIVWLLAHTPRRTSLELPWERKLGAEFVIPLVATVIHLAWTQIGCPGYSRTIGWRSLLAHKDKALRGRKCWTLLQLVYSCLMSGCYTQAIATCHFLCVVRIASHQLQYAGYMRREPLSDHLIQRFCGASPTNDVVYKCDKRYVNKCVVSQQLGP